MVHRDFQSQNLMLNNKTTYLIDFQGLRMGRQEYDLASLLYDPYMNHSSEDRRKLLELWEEVCEEEPIEPILKDCAAQRLMQTLGAFSTSATTRITNGILLKSLPLLVSSEKSSMTPPWRTRLVLSSTRYCNPARTLP